MNKDKFDGAVDLLVSECVASFEYTLGWSCDMFIQGLRDAIDTTLRQHDEGDQIVDRVWEKLEEYAPSDSPYLSKNKD